MLIWDLLNDGNWLSDNHHLFFFPSQFFSSVSQLVIPLHFRVSHISTNSLFAGLFYGLRMRVYVFVLFVALRSHYCLLSCHRFFKAFLDHVIIVTCFFEGFVRTPWCVWNPFMRQHSFCCYNSWNFQSSCIACVIYKEDEKMISLFCGGWLLVMSLVAAGDNGLPEWS